MSKSAQPTTLTGRALTFSNSISAIVSALANIGNTVGRVLADGKVQGSEYLDLLLAAPSFQTIIVNLPQAKKDWVVLSDDDRQAVFSQFASQFDIPADDVEQKIETTMAEAGKVYGLTDKLVKSVRTVINVWK